MYQNGFYDSCRQALLQERQTQHREIQNRVQDRFHDYSILQPHQRQLAFGSTQNMHLLLLFRLFEDGVYSQLCIVWESTMDERKGWIMGRPRRLRIQKLEQKSLLLLLVNIQKYATKAELCKFTFNLLWIFYFFLPIFVVFPALAYIISMKNLNKKQQDQFHTAFSLNYKYQNTPEYPLLLATLMQKTQSQLQQSRATKMLGDWIYQYQQMSEIIKYKYTAYVGRAQKILLSKFEQKAPVQYCISRFFICFYYSWKEFNAFLIDQLLAFDSYALSFLWYTSHHLVSDMQLAKQQPFLQFITTNYEEPLRLFDPASYEQAGKVLQIAYMINVHGCRENFSVHANNWALKMRLFQQVATDDQTSIKLSMLIIRTKHILLQQQKSKIYWLNHVTLFLQYLEENISEMNEELPLNKQILEVFQWMVGLEEVRELLLENQSRYVESIVNKIRADPHKSKFIFNNPKYSEISQILYKLYFSKDIVKTQGRVKEILEKFTNHSISILNDEKIYAFLQSYSEKEIVLQLQLITDILKLLGSAHIRRTLSAKVILILAKIINSALKNCILTQQIISMCLRSFNDSVGQKSADPIISQLRQRVAQLFLNIAKKYSWQDNNKSQILFLLCDEYEKNSKYTSTVVLQLLSILVRKFGFGGHSLHKLQQLIMQIHPKIIHDQTSMHEFISLLIVIFFSTKWEKASHLIENVCSRNPSPLAPFYSFQAQTLIKSNSSASSQAELQIISEILQSRQKWFDNRIKVNLILLEMYFLKLNSTQAFKVLLKVDNKLLALIKQLYSQSNYRLLSQIAGKTIASAGNAVNLQKLESYNWIRTFSFQILARSFYKLTSIYVCYIYSNIILKSDNLGMTIKWLCQGQFLDYLYQGLNDFLSKQKSFSLELVTTILVFKLFKYDPTLVPSQSKINDFTTLAKNVGWWDDLDNKFYFSMLQGDKGQWLLPEFQIYYEEAIVNYFKDYQKVYKQKRIQYLREMESLSFNQEDL